MYTYIEIWLFNGTHLVTLAYIYIYILYEYVIYTILLYSMNVCVCVCVYQHYELWGPP